MRHFYLLFVAVGLLAAQLPGDLPRVEAPGHEPDRKLPNGKSQREEIVKADHKRNLEDAAELARLAEQLKDDLDKGGSDTVSVKTLRKVDEIDKLARNIRGRLRRN